jgi:mono/diheme cytochrome c family protein
MKSTIHIDHVQTIIIGGGIACAAPSSTEAVRLFLERVGQTRCEASALPAPRLRKAAATCSQCHGTRRVEANASGEVGDHEWIDCPDCCREGRAS